MVTNPIKTIIYTGKIEHVQRIDEERERRRNPKEGWL
jgi:hypothetical protein